MALLLLLLLLALLLLLLLRLLLRRRRRRRRRDEMPTWVYALRLRGGRYYVGTTDRTVEERFAEHAAGRGSAWTRLHPPAGVSMRRRFESAEEARVEETRFTAQLAVNHGAVNVRGGEFSRVVEDYDAFWRTTAHVLNLAYDDAALRAVFFRDLPQSSAARPPAPAAAAAPPGLPAGSRVRRERPWEAHGEAQPERGRNRCYSCGRAGHYAPQCPEFGEESESGDGRRDVPERCFRCERVGHWVKDCPDASEEEDDTPTSEDDDDDDDDDDNDDCRTTFVPRCFR